MIAQGITIAKMNGNSAANGQERVEAQLRDGLGVMSAIPTGVLLHERLDSDHERTVAVCAANRQSGAVSGAYGM
jgi:hypothetical protein